MSRDTEEMLAYLGMRGADELFSDIPKAVRREPLRIPPGMPEMAVRDEVEAIFRADRPASDAVSFLGAGVYDHYVPAAVRSLAGRSEFITAYTPYQPEISQGMLQSLFEYQTLMAELTGMDAVNNSMYDGATAAAEAALMASRITDRFEFLIPKALSADKRSVLKNYCEGPGIALKEYGWDERTGRAQIDPSLISDKTAGLYIESPNYFGVIEDLKGLKERLGTAALVVGVNPISLALLKPPVEYGADIVVGDGQPLGQGMNFGGPSIGIFAARKEHVRKMPGRITGMTTDASGRRGFCMTLQTREQHIRRQKATSNICSNEALNSVQAAVYIALMGRTGLKKVAEASLENAHHLQEQLTMTRGFSPAFGGPFFNEFVIKTPENAEKMFTKLSAKGIYPGVPLKGFNDDWLLVACTERSSKEKRNVLIAALKEAV